MGTGKVLYRSAMGLGFGWLGGVAVGAGAMYLLDPDQGRRRRALLRDQTLRRVHEVREFGRKAAVDLEHRVDGIVAQARSRMSDSRDVSPDVLGQRVRTSLGRLVSHPHAIDVVANEDGHVTLSGQILRREVPRLLRRVAAVPGVVSVEDRLEQFDSSAGIPALQGGGHRVARPELLQDNWSPAIRVLVGIGGGSLVLIGLRRGGFTGAVLTGAGATMVLRAVMNLPLRRLFGVGGGRRGIDIQKDIHIDAPVEEVFAFFQRFENFPKFMSHLKKVEMANGRSHWELIGPGGVPIKWDAEMTRFEPNRLVAWKSCDGSAIRHAGIVRFEPDQRGGTLVEVHMSYNPPAGALGHALASMLGTDPKRVLDDDLLRLKSLLETGKATAHHHTVTLDEVAPPRDERTSYPGER